ncbi:hypothetical protein JRQ81_011616 [Phrynocephalus forsythii]|uniref:Phospholipase A2 inhibitor N-terminal domain-containing protein n=1 Tax=Phrynocephalus forsythii TaxID=171643 RepID=A0A9Q1AQQ8_9SAUR|nr:hypothetical protein JRQ81_011616 [Phrynocephalus forsythii]
MQGVLRLVLFSLLLPPGSLLECETCSATSSNCTGSWEICENNLDSCAISLMVLSQGEKPYTTVEKGCYSFSNCSAGWILVTFGREKFIRQSVGCCQEQDCTLPQLPPINTTANGKRCPACYAAPHACPTAIVNCTGFENYCLGLTMHQHGGKAISLKGCTTELTCEELQAGEKAFLGVDVRGEKIDCRPASQTSSLSGSFLLCLLLMMVLL